MPFLRVAGHASNDRPKPSLLHAVVSCAGHSQEASAECHSHGLKFKIYNTMRELSNRCREIWAFRAFDETYVRPEGAGSDADVTNAADWLKEHLRDRFVSAWSNPVENVYPGSSNAAPVTVDGWVDHPHEQDAAIKVKALTRWNK